MEILKKKIDQALNLYKSKKFLESESLMNELIRLNPKVSFLYNLLGLILTSQRKTEEAIKVYNKGLEIDPNNSNIYNNLGTLFKNTNDLKNAEKYYTKSIKLNNKNPEAQNNLGNLYINLNKYDIAIDCFKKAIKINKNFYIASYNLGILYKTLGSFANAKNYIYETIKVQPNFYNAHRVMSQLTKYKKSDPHIKSMERLFAQTKIRNEDKIILCFALGKAYDDIGNYKNAFNYFKNGNDLRRKEIKFSIDNEKKEFLQIKKIFQNSYINKFKQIKNKKDIPIFIIGMPRSGTTLVEQIISSHADVFGGDELPYFNNLIKTKFFKNELFSNNLLKKENLNKIRRSYLDSIKKVSSDSKQVTDKLPINFKWVGFIRLIFPNSKIIHCKRNAKDTCISIYKNYFTNTDLNYAYSFEELTKFYKLYDEMMNFWKKYFSDSIIDVQYETLIMNPKIEIPKIIKNCDLTWDTKCMKFYENIRPVKTASDTQVRENIYTSSVNTWKNYEKYLKKYFDNLNF